MEKQQANWGFNNFEALLHNLEKNNKIDALLGMIGVMLQLAKSIVIVDGLGVIKECGGRDFEDYCWDAYERFGNTEERMLTFDELESNPTLFYQYVTEILDQKVEPSDYFKLYSYLESLGKLRLLITQDRCGLAKKAGVKNVVEVLGSVNCNWRCTGCGSVVEREPKSVCECGDFALPDFWLYDTEPPEELIAQCKQAVSQADLILVLGTTACMLPVRYALEDATAPIVVVSTGSTCVDEASCIKLDCDLGKFSAGILGLRTIIEVPADILPQPEFQLPGKSLL